MRKLFVSLGILFLFFIISCGTYVRVNVLKPAEVYFGSNIKKIAVLDFNIKPNYDFGIKKNAKDTLQSAIIKNLSESKRIKKSRIILPGRKLLIFLLKN